jgi:hypothetical protein
VGTVLELVGAGAVLVAAWLADPRLALALAGVVLAVVGYAVADPRRGRPKG